MTINRSYMEIKQFDREKIDEVALMAADIWGKEQGAHGPRVLRIFSQHLSRYNYYTPELALEADDEEGMQAIAFTWMPGDTNDASSWLRDQLPNLSEKEKQTVLTNERYLMRIDDLLQAKMAPNSAKLSFFVSRKPGYGTPVLEALIDLLRQRGVEWLYLWTDDTCNWAYYPKHGYEQIGQGIAPEFSTDDEDYVYRLFRKRIG